MDIISHGLKEGEIGLLVMIANFGDQETKFFTQYGIDRLVELGLARTKEDGNITTIYLTNKGKNISSELTEYKKNKPIDSSYVLSPELLEIQSKFETLFASKEYKESIQ